MSRELLLHHHSTYLLPLFWAPPREHKTESSFVKLPRKKKKKREKSKHPRSEQTQNLRRLSELAGIDLDPSPCTAEPSSPVCHPGPAAFMAQKQTMREEKLEKGVSRFTWLTTRAGPSTRGRLLDMRSPIKLDTGWWAWKPFRQNMSSLPVHTALCVIFTGLLGIQTYISHVKNTLSSVTDWIGALEDSAVTVAAQELYAINQHIITQKQHLITLWSAIQE